jgi:peptidoglycan DL-endopeptidase CwlO
VLERDRHALAETGLAAGTVRTRVTRLEATQAEAVGLRQRLANQAAIGERPDRRRAVLATARAEVRALVRAERARREAARRALVAARPLLRARALGLGTFADAPAPSKVAAAAVRIALDQVGKPYRWGRAGRSRSTARDWSAGPTRTPGWRCPAPRASSGGRAVTSRSAACAPATWCSGPPTRPTPRPSTTSPSTSARR